MDNLIDSQLSIRPMLDRVERAVRASVKTGPVYVCLSRSPIGKKRSTPQNRLMWPLLKDFSEQVTHLDGKKYSPEQWKDILTAAYEGCMSYAPNLYGTGLIAFGARTSQYNKVKMSGFIEFIYAEGSERGVIWSEKSNDAVEEVRQ